MGRLTGKVALITGSDSGIGQASAIEMAREGADVVVTYFEDRAGAEETAGAVRGAGQKAIVAKLDTRNEKSIERLFDRALKEFGHVDVLMNNAGMDSAGVEVADMETERMQQAVLTNFFGYFWTCRRFIQERRKAGGGGSIINVTSIHEDFPRSGAADYIVTKGAQRNLTRTLALELAEDGITANNLAPGMVLTPFNQEAVDDPKVRKEQVQSIPMKRAAEPEEIARLAVFLASDDARYVTGATYVMDGGLSMQQAQGA
ncbi:MAG: glucose 1-dehydrogenase [Candidatus Limnocylindrales bacterium]